MAGIWFARVFPIVETFVISIFHVGPTQTRIIDEKCSSQKTGIEDNRLLTLFGMGDESLKGWLPLMLKLITPHIPLDSSLDAALGILESLGYDIVECNDDELSYRVDTDFFSVAIYPFENRIKAVWYNDPLGRESEAGIDQKVQLYLKRYGAIENWELRMDNGWMHYWFNPSDKVAMVYGIHYDVIRFNQHDES